MGRHLLLNDTGFQEIRATWSNTKPMYRLEKRTVLVMNERKMKINSVNIRDLFKYEIKSRTFGKTAPAFQKGQTVRELYHMQPTYKDWHIQRTKGTWVYMNSLKNVSFFYPGLEINLPPYKHMDGKAIDKSMIGKKIKKYKGLVRFNRVDLYDSNGQGLRIQFAELQDGGAYVFYLNRINDGFVANGYKLGHGVKGHGFEDKIEMVFDREAIYWYNPDDMTVEIEHFGESLKFLLIYYRHNGMFTTRIGTKIRMSIHDMLQMILGDLDEHANDSMPWNNTASLLSENQRYMAACLTEHLNVLEAKQIRTAIAKALWIKQSN